VSNWRCIILAAGRGADDPMAKAFGVEHKCTLPLAGKPMLQWVLDALRSSHLKKPFVVVIDNPAVIPIQTDVDTLPARASAPASAIAALEYLQSYPALITTGDHPLLTKAMVNHMLTASDAITADVCVGLATAETINAEYPETKRTYFNLGGTRVSGCNLFAVKSAEGLKLLERWQDLERNRKKPWKLVSAFGVMPIIWFALGMLTPERAFGHISRKLGITVWPVFLPFAEAAIDVDKPSDHALAEKILKLRSPPA
jgi:molybdopterin-guanine dinucleotide biosynthesis protein A